MAVTLLVCAAMVWGSWRWRRSQGRRLSEHRQRWQEEANVYGITAQDEAIRRQYDDPWYDDRDRDPWGSWPEDHDPF